MQQIMPVLTGITTILGKNSSSTTKALNAYREYIAGKDFKDVLLEFGQYNLKPALTTSPTPIHWFDNFGGSRHWSQIETIIEGVRKESIPLVITTFNPWVVDMLRFSGVEDFQAHVLFADNAGKLMQVSMEEAAQFNERYHTHAGEKTISQILRSLGLW